MKGAKGDKNMWSNIVATAVTSVLLIFTIVFVLDRSDDNQIIKAQYIKKNVEISNPAK